MDSSSIELPGSEIADVSLWDGELRILFSRAYVLKTMTGSAEQTRWWQAGTLVLTDAQMEAPLPTCPGVCAGGDVEQGVYVYRDMIPIPLAGGASGRVALRLRDRDAGIVAHGRGIRLDLEDVPKYIGHIRPGEQS